MTASSNVGAVSPRVIIADDDPDMLHFLAARCARMGFEVRTASNGLHAFAVARRAPPDVMIVDVNMPQVDGLSLCARLLAPNEKSVDVIVITGSSHPDTIERCRSFGVTYAQKGPALWADVQCALMQFFPGLAEPPAEVDDCAADAKLHQRPRVLIVDDDPDVAGFLGSRLHKYGVETLTAPNGMSGYLMALNLKPSVVISDYYMPNGDAPYLLWKLRSTPATEQMPVFIISARRLDEATQANLRREVCGRPGATRLFGKPLDFGELVGALQTFCGLDIHDPFLAPDHKKDHG